MKTRSILLASLFALALLVSACGPTTIQQAAPPPAAHSERLRHGDRQPDP